MKDETRAPIYRHPLSWKTDYSTLFFRIVTVCFCLQISVFSQDGNLTADNQLAVGIDLVRDPTNMANPRYKIFGIQNVQNTTITLSSPALFAHIFLAMDAGGTIIAAESNDNAFNSSLTYNVNIGNSYWIIITPFGNYGTNAQVRPLHLTVSGTVAAGEAPTISVHPTSQSVGERRAVVFKLGTTSLVRSFQWVKWNGSAYVGIPGAVSNPYSILAVKTADNGSSYRCIVTNEAGSSPSNAATLTVTAYTPSTNTWRQEEFAIVAYGTPNMTGNSSTDIARFQTMRAANFNLSYTTLWNGWSQSFDAATGYPYSNSYLLDKVAQVPGLKIMIHDNELENSTAVTSNYINSSSRSAMFGYFIADEPWYLKNHFSVNSGEALKKLEALSDADKTMPGFTNLRAGWGFENSDGTQNFSLYENYVEGFILNAETKFIATDYYPFNDAAFNGYFGFPAPPTGRFNFFRHLKTYANKVRMAKSDFGKSINFWGVVNSTKFIIGGQFTPEEKHLRYQASAFLLYGAKGIGWYTYILYPDIPTEEYLEAPVDTDGVNMTSNTLYEELTQLNGKLAKMGPTLMRLEWQATVHGTSVDPLSGEGMHGENGLPPGDALNLLETVSSSTPALSSTPFAACDPTVENNCGTVSSTWSDDSLAVGILKMGAYDVIMPFNKSVSLISNCINVVSGDSTSCTSNDNKTRYSVKGHVYPRKFDKTTGEWTLMTSKRVLNSGNWDTQFNQILVPGDMEMVWIDKGDLVPTRIIPLLLQ